MVAALRAALCVAMLLVVQKAPAQQSSTTQPTSEQEAKRAFDDGLRLLRAGRWVEAEERFRESLAITPRPSASYDLAFVLYKQGRARESAELLQRLLTASETSPDQDYRECAKVLLPNVLAQLSTLRVVIDPAGAEVRIDGRLVPLTGAERLIPLDPGAHHVEVLARGFVPDRLDVVTEAQGEVERRISLTASLSKTAMTGAPTQPNEAVPMLLKLTPKDPVFSAVAPWVTIGIGGALLAGAAVTGVFAKREDDTFREACPSLRNCDPRLVPMRDRAVQLGHITDALLVSGGAFIAGGVTWRILVSAEGRADRRGAFVVTDGVF